VPLSDVTFAEAAKRGARVTAVAKPERETDEAALAVASASARRGA